MASAPQTRDRSRSGWGTAFALVALAEGFTWAGLLIGMFLKYVTETTEAGVALFGMLHGIVFVVYVLVTLIVWWRLRWSVPVGLLALVASVPPLTTVPFEIWAQRRGLLRATPRD
jgi:integral membrane protein